ncbi:MAG TPA: ATP-binding protein, partial [Archangium sp.]|uniref:hybrid sensor histidine kinase/response regulator n=1 Tax=Archangium sp. TaxID=1872627 RepID=UPI002EDB38A4
LARDEVTPRDVAELREVVDETLEGTGRVRAIVQDLKAFTRSEEERFGPVELPQVIDGAQRLVRHQLQDQARLVRELDAVPPVFGNAARLGQVLVNLLVNALQAFSERDPQRNRIRVLVRAGGPGQVLVEVEDNGRGMAPEVLENLFSPFFTTKPVGEGTGLGLAISQSIIQSMGGRIEVHSTPGQGSTFRLVLPVFSGQVPEPRAPEQPGPRSQPRRRLLLIDDEPTVGTAVRELLLESYEVDLVAGGRAALQLLARGERYDAVLCDVVMPGMSGLDFVTELERLEPGLARRTGLMTGAVITPQTRAFITARASDFLQKPFEPEALLRFVERLLS